MGYRSAEFINRKRTAPMTPALQKVALVTGAARGIGLAVAEAISLPKAGAWRFSTSRTNCYRTSVEMLAAPGHTLGPALRCLR